MSKTPWCVGPSSPTRPARSIAKHDVESLQADVVDDLVEGALQEGRVDRGDRLGALEREARRRTAPPAARRCRRRSSARAAPSGGCSRPVPEFIAAVMPTTRSSRRHSSTSASPKTFVYCGGGGASARAGTRLGAGAGAPLAIDFGLAACHFSMPSRPPSSAGAKPLPLTVATWTTTGRSAASASRSASRSVRHVVAVDDADVGPVELLPQQAGRPERLDRLLQLRAEPLEARADAAGQLRQAALDALAGVPQLRVQADAVEVARQRADVRRDRHAVVVEHDDDRRAEPAGLVDRLERDAAGHRAVADHRDDLAVLAVAAAHRLLDPDRVADRGRGVAGAHDVVLGLLDRAERRQAAVLADRRELVAAAREDLVRVGLVADVPEDLVASASRAASAARRRARRCRGWRRSGRRSRRPCR